MADVLNNTTNAEFIPTIIANKCLQKLGAYFSLAKNVSKDSDWVATTQGATISVPKTGTVTAKDKTAGSEFTLQNPTATAVSVTLNKHKEVTFTIDDVTSVLENQNTQDRYANDGAIALAEAVETAIAAQHASLENTITWDRTSADTIDAGMLKIRKFFTTQKVPKLEQRFMWVDATVYNDIIGVEKYTNASWRGGNNTISEGQVIKTYGFQIEESQLVPTSGSPVAYHNLAYTRNGLVLASRPLPAPKASAVQYSVVNDPDIGIAVRTLFWYNAAIGAHQLTIDLLFGVAIMDNRRVVEIESF